MRLRVAAFSVVKAGERAEDCEDAFHFSRRNGAAGFVIADGASQSAFARGWARALAKSFATARCAKGAARERWAGYIERRARGLQAAWRNGINWDMLPWYLTDKAKRGAFSTLLSLKVQEKKRPFGSWSAFAIGDSCLFLVRRNDLKVAFPLNRADQFTSHPALLSSNPEHNERAWSKLSVISGETMEGDVFFLATDALAHWFLSEHEADENPWGRLEKLNDQEEFDVFVYGLRAQKKIENDDTTLLRISVLPSTKGAKNVLADSI